MSDHEIAASLAALPDAELAAVLFAATAGRPAFWPVRAALNDLAGVLGHVVSGEIVSPATEPTYAAETSPEPSVSGQVDAVPSPIPAAGIPSVADLGGYSPGGVPTFESVRDKVERRFGTAQGMGELDRDTPAGRGVDEQWQAREKAARERLDRIRKSLHGND
ncbi:hypothetical protein D5S18_32005 [Nocardia panacis]|uniref:PspA domain-containing protein n=1 Tax=Nocardia panacis TaxID=2340916 RepID=A0A3A4K7U7_9NOCA|nr:hypothetical protein [Nocardia panacis]RJO69268.1 hypothetical protein D5S18_32005 [Nocardia panacis]